MTLVRKAAVIPSAMCALGSLLAGPSSAQTLTADVTSLDVVSGGTQTLTLDGGPSGASKLYLLLGSTSGTAPSHVTWLIGNVLSPICVTAEAVTS